jgi:predicted nucleic acid-binding protein
MFAVYPVTPAIAHRGGILRGQFQAQGLTRSAPDMLIAATALEHQLVLATRNVRDFTGCGVQVVNPFAGL